MSNYAYIGGLTIGQAVPLALTAQGAIELAVGAGLPDLQAKFAGLLQLQASIAISPPSIAATLGALATLSATLSGSLLPDVAIDVSGIAAIAVQINLQIGLLEAQLEFAASLGASLGTVGVHAFHATGQAAEIIPGGIPGIGDTADVNALVLVAATESTWVGMQAVFKTST